MALTHNSKLAESEPSWGSVAKKKLPYKAFVYNAPGVEKDKVSTWTYPHHWVEGGSDPDGKGRYTKGTMYLHRGGLRTALQAAGGARSGKPAGQAIKAHLMRHARAIGMTEKDIELCLEGKTYLEDMIVIEDGEVKGFIAEDEE